MKPIIELRIYQDQYSSPKVARIPIAPSAYERTWRPLDEPGADADPFTVMICTPQPIIDREAFAGFLARAIVDMMAGRDTTRGYENPPSEIETYTPSAEAIRRAPR